MKVEIVSNGPGRENVLIDGEKVGEKLRIAAIQVNVNAGKLPSVTLTCLPDEITFNGETTEESMTVIVGDTLYSLIPEAYLKQQERQLLEYQFKELIETYPFGAQAGPDEEERRRATSIWAEIFRLRAKVGLKTAAPLWNNLVDRKLTAPYRDVYYWTTKDEEE